MIFPMFTLCASALARSGNTPATVLPVIIRHRNHANILFLLFFFFSATTMAAPASTSSTTQTIILVLSPIFGADFSFSAFKDWPFCFAFPVPWSFVNVVPGFFVSFATFPFPGFSLSVGFFLSSPEGFSLFSSSFLSSDAFTVQTVVNVTVSPACRDSIFFVVSSFSASTKFSGKIFSSDRFVTAASFVLVTVKVTLISSPC